MIKIGNTGIVGVYKGSTPITSIYKGIDKVFGSTSKGYIEFTANSTSSLYNFVLPIDFLGSTRTPILNTNNIPDNEKFITGTVDWGDGTVKDVTINENYIAQHTYNNINQTWTIRFTPTDSPNVPVINFPKRLESSGMGPNLTSIKSTIPVCVYLNGGYEVPDNVTIEPGTPIVFGGYNGKQYGCRIHTHNLTADSLLSNLLGDDTVTDNLRHNLIKISGGTVNGNFLKGCKTTKISCQSTMSVLDYREYLGPVNPGMPLYKAPSSDNYIQIYLGDKITDIRYIFTNPQAYEFSPVIMDLGQHIPEQGYIDLSGIIRWGYYRDKESYSVIPTAENARDLKAEGLSMDVWVDYDGKYEWNYTTELEFRNKGYTLVNK